ncbi:MAG: hypothetical protein V4726_05765 [Verrucomicrobiota bacterium]
MSDTITLTHAELAQIIAQAVTAAIGTGKRPMTAAEKQQAYRDRRKNVTGVTGKVTPDGESVTGVTKKVTPPSPPPLSPTPPIPTPTPGEHTRVCEAPEFPDSEPPDGKESKPSRFPLSPPVAAALQKHFNRRATTAWSPKETAAARRLRATEAQLLADLELFGKARAAGWEFYRRDTLTLLNNWQAEVERSEDFLKTVNTPKNGTDSRTNRPPVSRNAAPLDPNRPSLNATAVNGSAADLAKYGRPDPDENGKSYW